MANPFHSASWFNVARLKPRLRSHVRVRRHRYRGAVWFVLDDGAAGRVHRFPRGAYLLIGRLDGTHTVEQLWERIVDELGEDAPSQDDVIAALGQLHGADLLSTDVTPDTAELFKRQKKQRRQLWLQNLKSPMSLRIPLVDPDAFLKAVAEEADLKLAFICSPNNPTGNLVPAADVLRICEALPETIIVLDEAYIEFSEAGSLSAEAARRDNLVVLRTLSKAYGLAGARVGCAIGTAELIA